jgi:hypothetical protein
MRKAVCRRLAVLAALRFAELATCCTGHSLQDRRLKPLTHLPSFGRKAQEAAQGRAQKFATGLTHLNQAFAHAG